VYYKSVFLLDRIRGVDEDDHRGEKADENEAGCTNSLHAALARVLGLTNLKIICRSEILNTHISHIFFDNTISN
jgi:hypothetical protein